MKKLILALLALSICLCAFGDETLTGNYSSAVSYAYKSVNGSKTIRDNGGTGIDQGFSFGTSTESAQINAYHSYTYGLKSDTESVVDLLSFTDLIGDDVSLSKYKAVVVKNLSETSWVTVGKNAQFAAWDGLTISLPPKGVFSVAAPQGWPIASGSYIYLNTDDTASCEVTILGTKQ